MRLSLVALASLACMGLAGCASSNGTDTVPPSAIPTELQNLTVDSDKGIVRGVVVTEAIVPIADATVKILSLNLTQKTTANGAFLFKDLKPGSYFVQASKLGYKTIQSQAEVQAGNADPPAIRIALPTDLASLPFARLTSWNGFIECGAGFYAPPPVDGGASTNPCFVDEANSKNTQEVAFDAGIPTFAQLEMVWDNTQAVSTELSLGIYDPATVASDFVGASGTSPVIVRVNGTVLAQYLGDNAASMLQRVFPGGSSNSPATVFTNQKFTIYTTQFHGFEPRADWSFYEDGLCETAEKCGA